MKKILLLVSLSISVNPLWAQEDDAKRSPFMVTFSVGTRGLLNTNKSKDLGHIKGGFDPSSHDSLEYWYLGYREITTFSLEGFYYVNENVLLGLSYEGGMLRSGLVKNSINREEHSAMHSPLNIIRSSICFYDREEKPFKNMYLGISAGYLFTCTSAIDQPIRDRLGIHHFKELGQFNLGLLYRFQIPIEETGFYMPVQVEMAFPIAGYMGAFKMIPNSNYTAENKVRIYTIMGSVGLGYRFGHKQ